MEGLLEGLDRRRRDDRAKRSLEGEKAQRRMAFEKRHYSNSLAMRACRPASGRAPARQSRTCADLMLPRLRFNTL